MTTHICKRCGKQHDLFYRIHFNGSEHLVYVCTRTHESFYLPMIENLPIPKVKARKLLNQERKAAQTELF